MQKLVRLEEVLHERVVGQDEAVARGGQRHPPQPRRPVRPAPPDRLVPVPRPDRRRQDRAGPGAGRVPVRRRAGHGPHRHERVHGEALRGPPHRRASRLRRLRRGRPAHRGGAPPALRGGAARRDREGPPRRLQRAAAGARRRPPHRRPGPHGRLHQRRADHDVEPARAIRWRSSSPSSSTGSTTSSGSGRSPRTTSATSSTSSSQLLAAAPGRPAHHARGHRRGRGRRWPARATTRPSAPGRSSGSSSARSATGSPSAILEGKVGEGDTVVVDAAGDELTVAVSLRRPDRSERRQRRE